MSINRQERQALAKTHTEQQEKLHHEEIQNCAIATKRFDMGATITIWSNPKHDTRILLEQCGTSDAIVRHCVLNDKQRMAALNFASYKHPGGGFLSGSMAQEEALCHDSFLYNVLSNRCFEQSFYKQHIADLNDGLYTCDALYSPDVLFFDKYPCDIITCAAVNVKAAVSKGLSSDECDDEMYNRCLSVLDIARHMRVEVLILGAFGCGVFGNKPSDVANAFKDGLSGEFDGYFKTVIFAIPDDRNMSPFREVFG